MKKIKIGVSSCLLGEKVRYDGGHKKDNFIVSCLGQHVDFLPVCPEFECGLGVPREAMRLEGDAAEPRLITIKTRIDLTEKMLHWCQQKNAELTNSDLSGFIFKSRSPSSGMERVKVYPKDGGMPVKNGRGIFAQAFMEAFPLLPVEEEGRLNDPELRESFVERIFVMRRWQDFLESERSTSKLIDFHTRHKLLLMSHSPEDYKKLGQTIANTNSNNKEEILKTYPIELMQALKKKTTARKHRNVMQHILGYFKKQLSSDEKQEMQEAIDSYVNGFLPLIVPITLLNHYVRKYQNEYLTAQYYLNPHPAELALRNHP